ncbi:hypothetical protein OEZ86_008352 [Tetradesmus obliquus]|nr:hypothetical protein OEZ86_008352 [Tetradesmus obliquus]
MDCGLFAAGLKQLCAASQGPSRLSKQKSSRKHGELDVELDREWPVDPKQYELLHKAGKGSSAAVYCARCKPFDEIVAVKKLDLDASLNYDLMALIREATLMRKLQHPNVLQLHTSFVVGRELWLVMPYMAHGSVRSIMKKKGLTQGLDEVVIASIMRGVLQGLDYVHQNGGIHRDIKADNILMSEDGAVRLADFGVAAARARQVSMINLDMSAVMATTFVGTPCWMAPEVMAQDDGYDASADMWSVGITMIELAQGRPPLSRAHPMRVLMDTINNPPPSLDEHFSKCFKEVVDACLCKDPSQRPSAAELLGFRFFRMAREPEFLVEHFLAGLEVQCEHGRAAAQDADAALDGVGSRAASGLVQPQLLGGMLRRKSALGLQELVLGRIGSRLKSSWQI